MSKQYQLHNIRTLLIEGFSVEELRIFCFDTMQVNFRVKDSGASFQ